jgi:hypothetical protein
MALNIYRQPACPRIAYGDLQAAYDGGMCFSDIPPQIWLGEAKMKADMREHKICISVSNSVCDSGELVTAGYIFLKHPTLTHRHCYNQSLRILARIHTSFRHFDPSENS